MKGFQDDSYAHVCLFSSHIDYLRLTLSAPPVVVTWQAPCALQRDALFSSTRVESIHLQNNLHVNLTTDFYCDVRQAKHIIKRRHNHKITRATKLDNQHTILCSTTTLSSLDEDGNEI